MDYPQFLKVVYLLLHTNGRFFNLDPYGGDLKTLPNMAWVRF